MGDKFPEPWAELPRRNGGGSDPQLFNWSIYYGASLVTTFALVEVAGARANMPLPKPGTRDVKREEHALAAAVDFLGSLEEYMGKCTLTLVD